MDSPWSILLVEDNPGDADLVQALLSPHIACRWVHVVRLDEAMQVLARKTPDVVLLDMGLPDSRGLQTLRSIQHATRDVPVVVLTGNDDASYAAEAVRSGAQEYVSKRMMTEELLVRVVRHSVERQRLLMQTRAAEQRLRVMIDANHDALVVLDSNGVVRLANPAADATLTPAGGSLSGGKLPFDHVAAEAEGEVTLGEGEQERVLELRTAPIEWEGGRATLVSARDVSERRQSEELRRRLLHADRLRSIGELAAGVAHEVNNPAALALSNAESLLERVEALQDIATRLRTPVDADAEQHEAIDRLDALTREIRNIVSDDRAALLRIRAIVRSLRVFSRLDRDHVEAIRLDELVGDACIMVANEIRHRAQLVRELQPVPPIYGDPGKLTQVVVNLLVNAAQAIPERTTGDQSVTVCTGQEGTDVLLDVRDTGVGIPEELRERIFEPFYTSKIRGQGTGLGLPLSLEIVRQHGGEITVQSEPGGGSSFRVRLPCATGLRPSQQGRTDDETPARTASGRVLLVDDEQGLVRALRRVLRPDHEVVTAFGGREAIQILENDRGVDAIVCDLMMPDLDGVAVCEWLERHAPQLLARTMLMSGGALTDRTRGFVERAQVRLLEKPVPADELKDEVGRLVAYSREGSGDG